MEPSAPARKLRALTPDRHADGLAPLPDLRVVRAIDRLVTPDRLGRGERLRVHVVRRRVHRQQHEALAVAAVHLDFAAREPRPNPVVAPPDLHRPARHLGRDDRLDRAQIRPAGDAADDPQTLADGADLESVLRPADQAGDRAA